MVNVLTLSGDAKYNSSSPTLYVLLLKFMIVEAKLSNTFDKRLVENGLYLTKFDTDNSGVKFQDNL